MIRFKTVLFNMALLAFSFAVALTAAEAVMRVVDGYALFSLSLALSENNPRRRAEEKAETMRETASAYAAEIRLGPGVDPAWYNTDPPPLPARRSDPALAEAHRVSNGRLGCTYQWNAVFLENWLCNNTDVLNECGRIWWFEPMDGERYPLYRFHQSTLDPSGLSTNRYGWRGPDITPDKASGAVRIAFVGSSTTVSRHWMPFSYPEYAGHWLNMWAKTRNLPVTFETINTGRSGISSPSMAAIVVKELIPVEPDVVVYFEGSNQFWPERYVMWNDPKVKKTRPKSTFEQITWLESYSALGARVVELIRRARADGAEPPKPGFSFRLPAGFNENDPDPKDERLPVNLPIILGDLDKIASALDGTGAVTAVASFKWLVHDGMVLDIPRDITIYRYLNETFWPFTYAHMRRMADLQNRVFEKYARRAGIWFLDFASQFPDDPRLFTDAIHMTSEGVRLKGWIMFNELASKLEKAIAEGRLPRPDREPLAEHPYFTTETGSATPVEFRKRRCPQKP